MFLYRDHRGSLTDSMQTVKEMASFSELKAHVENIHGRGEIEIKDYCYDKRIQWQTHIVTINGYAVGFTNQHVDVIYE